MRRGLTIAALSALLSLAPLKLDVARPFRSFLNSEKPKVELADIVNNAEARQIPVTPADMDSSFIYEVFYASPGDSFMFEPGEYNLYTHRGYIYNIVLPDKVSLIATDPNPANTVLRPVMDDSTYTNVMINADYTSWSLVPGDTSSVIKGFTFKPYPTWSPTSGHHIQGIQVSRQGTTTNNGPIIRNCVFDSLETAISINDSYSPPSLTPLIKDVTITNFFSVGIDVTGGGSGFAFPTIRGTTISDFQGDPTYIGGGWGVHMMNAIAVIDSCHFSNIISDAFDFESCIDIDISSGSAAQMLAQQQIFQDTLSISNSEIANSNIGVSIYVQGAPYLIQGNNFHDNNADIYFFIPPGQPILKSGQRASAAQTSSGILRNNEFVSPDSTFRNELPNNVDAQYNYWGPQATAEMEACPQFPCNISTIIDSLDNPAYGFVDYRNWLPNPTTGVPDITPIPLFSVGQNYPNPFNPTTSINYTLQREGRVRIDVFDVAGRRIDTLVDGIMKAGQHIIEWDGKDKEGRDVASGIYFYRVEFDGRPITKKMVLIK
ncbi:T9SS C-terminal target domain-containing protein [Candidatus Woesearchaeota archaeon]|nr:MAG: T9SS C-terminal target domain-containing protein [Candidatus Woesearchaeota archaeon]